MAKFRRLEPCVTAAGLGAICAAGAGADALEKATLGNADCLRPCDRLCDVGIGEWPVGAVPDGEWRRLFCRRGRNKDDPAFALADEAMGEAMDRARGALSRIRRERVGLVLSTTKANISALEKAADGKGVREAARRHIIPYELAVALAERHGAKGGVRCVSAGCVSGLLAVREGAAAILRHEWDAAIVTGVDCLSGFIMLGFASLKALAPEGCRPFDRNRNGLSPGEGGGAIVLTRSEMTDAPYGKILGWGSSNDANHITGPSRDGAGLAEAMRRALSCAGITPRDVDYVHAHGTGTPYNDAMESLAIRAVFGDDRIPVGSSKGMLGHTFGSAGVLEAITCMLALKKGILPGTPRLSDPDPIAPAGILREPRSAERARIMLKIMTGFGGMNFAMVIGTA